MEPREKTKEEVVDEFLDKVEAFVKSGHVFSMMMDAGGVHMGIAMADKLSPKVEE